MRWKRSIEDQMLLITKMFLVTTLTESLGQSGTKHPLLDKFPSALPGVCIAISDACVRKVWHLLWKWECIWRTEVMAVVPFPATGRALAAFLVPEEDQRIRLWFQEVHKLSWICSVLQNKPRNLKKDELRFVLHCRDENQGCVCPRQRVVTAVNYC